MVFDLIGKAVKNLRLPTVDYNNSPIKIIHAQEGDVNSRFFSITLFDDRGDISLEPYSAARLNATMPDGELYITTSETEIDKDNNVIVCKIAGNMLSQPGKVSCDISLSITDGDDTVASLTSQTFYLFVSKSQSEESAIDGSDGQNLISQLFKEVSDLSDSVGDKLDKNESTDTHTRVYAVDSKGNQTMLKVSQNTGPGGALAVRDGWGGVSVPLDPGGQHSATSKKYVDDQVAAKVDKVTDSDPDGEMRVYAVKADGTQTVVKATNRASGQGHVALRDSYGSVTVLEGGLYSATPKYYVDNKITALTEYIDTKIAELKAYVDEKLASGGDSGMPTYYYTVDGEWTTEEQSGTVELEATCPNCRAIHKSMVQEMNLMRGGPYTECRNCGQEIGSFATREGLHWCASTDSFFDESEYSECPNCGEQFSGGGTGGGDGGDDTTYQAMVYIPYDGWYYALADYGSTPDISYTCPNCGTTHYLSSTERFVVDGYNHCPSCDHSPLAPTISGTCTDCGAPVKGLDTSDSCTNCGAPVNWEGSGSGDSNTYTWHCTNCGESGTVSNKEDLWHSGDAMYICPSCNYGGSEVEWTESSGGSGDDIHLWQNGEWRTITQSEYDQMIADGVGLTRYIWCGAGCGADIVTDSPQSLWEAGTSCPNCGGDLTTDGW